MSDNALPQMLILNLIASIRSQVCFSLAGSQSCAGMDNFAVLPSKEFKDVASLDQYIGTRSFNQSSNVDKFKQNYQCPGFVGNEVRYSDTTFCSFLVKVAESKCLPQYTVQSTRLNLCSSTCISWSDSIKTVFTNSSVCDADPSAQSVTARGNMTTSIFGLTSLPEFCNIVNNDPKSLDSKTCFNATSTDNANCGFLRPADQISYCVSNPSDSCCVVTAPATSPPSILKSGSHLYIILGIVAGTLILIAIAFYVYTRMNARTHRPTTMYSPRESRTGSKSISEFGNRNPRSSIDLEAAYEVPRSSLFTTMRASAMFENMQGLPNTNHISQGTPNAQDNTISNVMKVQVTEDYDATMEDEVNCTLGDIIKVKEVFDDGWASGLNITTNEEGVFPMAVCKRMDQNYDSRHQSDFSHRSDSLLPPPKS